MSRTFFIRLNLDDMCAELDTLRPDQHAEWIAGFRAGCRGRIPSGWDGPRLMGAEFGLSCWNEAEGYRAKQSEKGKKSAEARIAKTGTADPRGFVNHGSAAVLTAREPTVNPSNIQHPTSTSEQPEPKREKDKVAIAPRFSPPSVSDVDSYCDQNGYLIDSEAFVDFYASKGWKVGNSPMKDWKAAVRTWVKRDASKPKGSPVCPHPPGSDAAANWWILNGALGNLQ
jgi:hypothetical protein